MFSQTSLIPFPSASWNAFEETGRRVSTAKAAKFVAFIGGVLSEVRFGASFVRVTFYLF